MNGNVIIIDTVYIFQCKMICDQISLLCLKVVILGKLCLVLIFDQVMNMKINGRNFYHWNYKEFSVKNIDKTSKTVVINQI